MEYFGNISYDQSILDPLKKVVIYGAGIYGKKVWDYLKRNNCDNVVCFCDKNEILDGTYIDGKIVVTTPEKAFREYYDAHWIVYGRYMHEMLINLLNAKISKIHVYF